MAFKSVTRTQKVSKSHKPMKPSTRAIGGGAKRLAKRGKRR